MTSRATPPSTSSFAKRKHNIYKAARHTASCFFVTKNMIEIKRLTLKVSLLAYLETNAAEAEVSFERHIKDKYFAIYILEMLICFSSICVLRYIH